MKLITNKNDVGVTGVALQALIVDDEPPARLQLRLALERFPDVVVVGEAANGREALQLVGALAYDVLFMDIRMPGLDGLQVAQRLQERPRAPRVVFVTGHADFAVPAFRQQAFDYLLKPVEEERLQETLQRLRAATAPPVADAEQPPPARPDGPPLLGLLAQREEVSVPVALAEIIYIESQGDLVRICTRDEQLPGRYAIADLAMRLPAPGFFRCHRSFIVNTAQIREMVPMFNGTFLLRLKDRNRAEIPVSRRHARHLKALFYLPDRGGAG